MNRIKKALEKCRTYVAVQKFGCGITCIGHGVEDNILQFLNEADEELARLEKHEPTLMSDCISAGLPLDVALKYDVQLCRLTNYVRDKTLADCVKQEPIDDELKAKLDAFSDLKTILFEPERWTVSEHATYFGFFCWGWKYAKKPYAAPVQPMKREPVATEHPLVAYAESYEQIARSGSSGKVSALAVATDIRQNMI
ncbi:MAG: hypothetical protein ABFD89_11625, partial [Bryobacteraceae bacterium]